MQPNTIKQAGLVVIAVFFSAHLVYGESGVLLKNDDLPWKKLVVGRSHLSIGGSYRLRGEFQDEYDIKTYGTGDNEDFLLSRLRLDFAFRFRNLTTFLQLQDARVFGSSFDDSDFKESNPNHDVLDIRQAYVDYEIWKRLEIKLGRQEIAFADRRIFGPGNWGNTGRYVWDAGRLRYHDSHIDSHFFAGRFIIADPDRWPNTRRDGPTAFANYTTIENLPFELDLFYVLKKDDHGDTQGEKGEGDLTSHSVGFRMGGTSGAWDYGATFVRQLGRWGQDKIRANGLAASLGYTFDLLWSPHLTAQLINGSGDDDPKDGRKGTFDGVFSGADTVLYGWMNLFFWSNIRECRLDLMLSPRKNFSYRGEYHYFTLDEKRDAWYYPGKPQRRDAIGNSGRELGHEVDLTFHYTPVKWLDILGSYCFFVPGEFIEKTGPHPVTHWIFMQTEIFF